MPPARLARLAAGLEHRGHLLVDQVDGLERPDHDLEVDDPRQAVQRADELVAQVMTSLAETFAKERSELEGFIKDTDQPSTENLRVALRRYRSFFQRLLAT